MSFIFKDVLIFKGDKDAVILVSKYPIPLTLNFDEKIVLGKSCLRVEEGSVYADIEIFEEKEHFLDAIKKSYPYVGGIEIKNGFDVRSTSIGLGPNLDGTIPDLSQYIISD